MTAKATERETPHSLFRLLLLEVEIWWAIACVASLFVWFTEQRKTGDDEERYFRFWPRETCGTSSKATWKRLLLFAAKPPVGYGDVLSPGLRIYDRRSRGHVVTVATLSQMSLGRPIIICPTNRSSSQKVAFSLKKSPQADSSGVLIDLFTHLK